MFGEAATDVEDTGSGSAESNEGVAQHAIGEGSLLCFLSLASRVAMLPCLCGFLERVHGSPKNEPPPPLGVCHEWVGFFFV